jgi:hypothetical protein
MLLRMADDETSTSSFFSSGFADENAYIMNRARDDGMDLPAVQSWWGLAKSYKDTADLTIDQALQDSALLDVVAVPACFLYRHYLELALKALSYQVTEMRGGAMPPMSHDLTVFWDMVKGDFYARERARVEELMKDWIQFDKGSFTFRYPVDKAGKASIPKDFPGQLPLSNLKRTVHEMAEIFFFVSYRLYQEREARECLEDHWASQLP